MKDRSVTQQVKKYNDILHSVKLPHKKHDVKFSNDSIIQEENTVNYSYNEQLGTGYNRNSL